MKKILLSLCLLVSLSVHAQFKPIEGVLGVKFGASFATAAAGIKAKGGVVSKESTPDRMFIDNISLAGRTPDDAEFLFVTNKFYAAIFTFKPKLEPQLVDYYKSLVRDIEQVYGTGQTIKDFKPPYEEGDGYEVQAITTGNATLQTYWSNSGNYVYIKPNPDGTVTLAYANGELNKIITDKDKEKQKADL